MSENTKLILDQSRIVELEHERDGLVSLLDQFKDKNIKLKTQKEELEHKVEV
jgi:hypothetical protein